MTHPSLPPRRVPRPGSCLGDASELFAAAARSEILRFIGAGAIDGGRVRKHWEWDYIADTAARLGCLDGRQRGLGLGAGREALIYYFAGRCGHVLATDLYSAPTPWERVRRATLADLYDAPYEYPRSRLSFATADMRRIPLPDASVDFVWSCSSIEHVPSLADTYRVYAEIHRVLSPGGYAILTTEYCLSEPPYLLPALNALDEHLFRDLIQGLGGLTLVGGIDLRPNCLHPANAVQPRRHVESPPLPGAGVVEAEGPTTMVLPVGISAIVPLGLVLQKTERVLAKWDDLALAASYRTYSDAVDARELGEHARACSLLQDLYRQGPDLQSLQFYLHVAFVYLEGLLRSTAFSRHGFLEEVEPLLGHLPEGAVQDADVLGLVAFHLAEFGETQTAAALYRQAAISPSTLPAVALAMAGRHVHLMASLGRAAEGLELIADLLVDIVAGGSPVREWWQTVERALGEGKLGPFSRREALDHLRRRLCRTKEARGRLFDPP